MVPLLQSEKETYHLLLEFYHGQSLTYQLDNGHSLIWSSMDTVKQG